MRAQTIRNDNLYKLLYFQKENVSGNLFIFKFFESHIVLYVNLFSMLKMSKTFPFDDVEYNVCVFYIYSFCQREFRKYKAKGDLLRSVEPITMTILGILHPIQSERIMLYQCEPSKNIRFLYYEQDSLAFVMVSGSTIRKFGIFTRI